MEVPREKLDEFVGEWLKKLPRTEEQKACVFGLKGNLGAGKTTFVQAVARGLGVRDVVNSPTFVIAQTYKTTDLFFKKMVHIDAYRLESEDVDTIGFSTYVSSSHTLVLVEWPEHLPGGLPEHAKTLRFKTLDKDTRDIAYV